MLALIASVLLGLYVFLPDFLFSKFAAPYTELKKQTRTKTEEVMSGAIVALIPFLLTLALSWGLSWHVGNTPLEISHDSAELKATDYKTVFLAAYKDDYFIRHEDDSWDSLGRVARRQARFLLWNYLFLFLEILAVYEATVNYGRLYKYRWFRQTIADWILKRSSEWYVLLTTFALDPAEKRTVVADILTTSTLYTGSVGNYFLSKDGELSGLLLKKARRFQYSRFNADREKLKPGESIDIGKYWAPIPGANFYIAATKIENINVRYELPSADVTNMITEILRKWGAAKFKVEQTWDPTDDPEAGLQPSKAP